VTLDVLRRIALVHGVLAWISAVSLLVVSLRLLFFRSRAFLRASAAFATMFTALAFASGATLDLGFRVHLRQRLFVASRALGWLFERKLHLSFGALLFSLAALAALFATNPTSVLTTDKRLSASAKAAYLAAALFALFSCVASSLVAARARF